MLRMSRVQRVVGEGRVMAKLERPRVKARLRGPRDANAAKPPWRRSLACRLEGTVPELQTQHAPEEFFVILAAIDMLAQNSA
jgi:hypothetical protein